MTIRMLLTITTVSLTVGSGVAYATGAGAGSGVSWNQVAADASARAYAAEGWCFRVYGPCLAPQPSLQPDRDQPRRHNRKLDH
jgi:hypothetical protein